MISRLLALALLSIKEALGKKFIYLSLLFAVVMVLASRVFTSITPGAEIAFMMDIGLAAISFLGGVVVLFVAADFVPEEIKKRTIYTVLTYPVRRFEFILGKFIGIAGLVLILHFLMCLILLAHLSLCGAALTADIFSGLVLIYGTLLIFSSLVIMGSVFLSPWVNIIFSLFFYLLGHLLTYLRHLAERLESVSAKFILTFSINLLPDLERFEVKDKLVVGLNLPPGLVGHSFAYAFLYIFIVMMLAYVFFNEKEV